MTSMMESSEGPEPEISGINVTPLVDITLVLLILFMVTTGAITRTEGMAVDKPDAATGQAMESVHIVLACHADGRVAVNGEETPDDTRVDRAIRRALDPNREAQGIVQCDQAARVGSMVRLLDLLRAAGVHKYAIATEKPSSGLEG